MGKSKTPATVEPGTVPAGVVAFGASAGGLESLSSALGSLDVGQPFAYVVAQHMSPDHDNPLVDLLSRTTRLTVREATQSAPLEAGVILVCPANTDIAIDGSVVRLVSPGDSPGPRPSIDVLLSSLGRCWGSRAVGVILSGTGSDGTDGLRVIRTSGGLTIAQEPDDAQFDAMPRSAIATGCVEIVTLATQIGSVLARVPAVSGPPLAGDFGIPDMDDDEPTNVPTAPTAGDRIGPVVAELRRLTGIDFAEYKRGTLERQIERRRVLVGAKDLDSYLHRLTDNVNEAHALARALFVTVTSFFRDPDSWAALDTQLRRAWSDEPPTRQFRIWVPGCATGEEAYTIAMVAADVLGSPADLSSRLKIFATDLCEEALTVGRRGMYPEAAVAAIPERIRARWWRQERTGWEVSPLLRDAVVFARHNVAADPPFPRIDLVSIRNTLIYFQEPLQTQVLSLCRAALVPGGLLFLGNSERVASNRQEFTAVDGAHRIYRRSSGRGVSPLPSFTSAAAIPPAAHPAGHESLHGILLARMLPPSLVTDVNDDVIDVVGDVSRWCWVAAGPPSLQVVALLRPDLRAPVRTLLLRLRHGDSDTLEMHTSTSDGPVSVTATRLDAAGPGTAVITFREHVAEHQPVAGGNGDSGRGTGANGEISDAEVARVAGELAATQEALQVTVEELSASNEELRALNEELQAASEESQSSNEELEAANEELSTLNQEVQVRSANLVAANRDLQNIQSSVSAGLVLVDLQLRVTRFTSQAVRLFALIQDDLGRRLTSIPTTMEVPDLGGALRAAVSRNHSTMTALSGRDGDLLLQVKPYVDEVGRALGAVVTVTDVTELSTAQRRVAEELRRFTAVTDALVETVWQRDPDGALVFLSRGVERIYGLSRSRVLADPGLLVAAIHRDDRERVAVVRSAVERGWQARYRIVRPDGAIRWVEESAVPVSRDGNNPGFTVGSILDVTELIAVEETAERRHRVAEALFNVRQAGVLLLDSDGRILRANEAFADLVGYDLAALTGMPLRTFTELGGPSEGSVGALDLSLLSQPEVKHFRLLARDGTPRWIMAESSELPVEGVSGVRWGTGGDKQAETIVTIRDVSPMIELSGDLASQVRFDQQTGVLARMHFHKRVDEELSRSSRSGGSFAVLWVDLDGFKEVNDTYGHRAGDAVLAEVAHRLRDGVRGHDCVGRLGGDEFGVIITGVDDTGDLDLAIDRIQAALREPIKALDGLLFIGGSIGVAVAPEDGATGDVLLHNADTAMYAAKADGGDTRAYFRSAMNESARRRAALRQELSAAVRAQDFRMHYQPIVDLTTGAIVMVEALIRWQRDGRLVAAGEFIEEAEQTGQLRSIGLIGRRIVESDLAVLDETPGLVGLPVCINFSVDELAEPELAQHIVRWDPPGGLGRIVIEVTEHTLLPGIGNAMDALHLLQRLGASISIDDFGTGYSNMALLRDLRPAIIKIDRSLVSGATDSRVARELLTASVQMAHALRTRVVVEGVESPAERDLVRELGADYAQGYLFARPMSLEALQSWTAQRSTDDQ